MNNELQIVSWNVCGFGGPNNVRIARAWIAAQMKPIEIVCFQELRALEDIAKLQLQNVFPQGRYHIDSLQNGRVGCAIAAAE
jgi:exonuclease III